MKLKNHTPQKNVFPMAVVLGRSNSVHRLVQVVSQTFDSIRLIESQEELERHPTTLSPLLTVITDSFPGGVSPGLLDQVKNKLSPGALICIANNISAKKEIELRSIGLVFLGSYREFFDCAGAIIQ